MGHGTRYGRLKLWLITLQRNERCLLYHGVSRRHPSRSRSDRLYLIGATNPEIGRGILGQRLLAIQDSEAKEEERLQHRRWLDLEDYRRVLGLNTVDEVDCILADLRIAIRCYKLSALASVSPVQDAEPTGKGLNYGDDPWKKRSKISRNRGLGSPVQRANKGAGGAYECA